MKKSLLIASLLALALAACGKKDEAAAPAAPAAEAPAAEAPKADAAAPAAPAAEEKK
jgi:nitrous oxide reductase accessory protein NosL